MSKIPVSFSKGQSENELDFGLVEGRFYLSEDTGNLYYATGTASKVLINSHTHTNKSVLDGITSDKVSSWDSKQDKLTFDSTPTDSSENPVTSGGIKTYVDKKLNTSDFLTGDEINAICT